MIRNFIPKGEVILSRDLQELGTTTGGQYPCRLHGCNGVRIAVRWSDGKVTYPCSKGLEVWGNNWKIQ